MIPTTNKAHGRARWRVLGLLFLLSVITYLDRVCISTTAPAMMQELGITPLEMGMVFSVFVLGYALLEIPGGWMADRFGARAVLTRIVLQWSFFTAVTAYAWSFASLVAIRFLFGAGAFPNNAHIPRSRCQHCLNEWA